MTNEHLFLKQMIMLNNFLNTGAMSARDYEKSAGGLMEKMGYLIKDLYMLPLEVQMIRW